MREPPDGPADAGSGPHGGSESGGDPDLIGTVLAGRYRIESLLGVGAMGAVYVGEHLHMGRRDAIKVLRSSLARDEEAIARFTRGARNLSAIRHPNVCAIYDFGTTEAGFHYLAMEYVDGASLTDAMEREGGVLSVERATRILGQAADALKVAHDRGIVHRDLKPDNIMLTAGSPGTETVKVVDFDIALGPQEGEDARVTRHGYVVGTPEYMSPEQLTGDPLEGRSDIYSLALIYFRMLTGRLPFPDGTAQEVMVHRLTGDPLSLAEAAPAGAGIPPGLEPVVRRALARKADERYEDVEEFAREVREGVGQDEVEATPGPSEAVAHRGGTHGAEAAPPVPETRVSPSGPAAGQGPRRALLAGVAVGLGLLVLGGGGYLALWGNGDADEDEQVALAPDDEDAEVDEDPAAEPEEEEPDEEAPEEETETDEPEELQEPVEPEEEDQEEGEEEEPEPEPDPVPEPPATPDPAGPTPEGLVELPDEDATQVLARMFDRLGPSGDGPTEDPEELIAIRDTVHAVWYTQPIARGDSATAANNLFIVFNRLGEDSHADAWFDWVEELEDDPYDEDQE